MIINSHFEKVSFEQYKKDRLENLIVSCSLEYFINNGIFPKSTSGVESYGILDEMALKNSIDINGDSINSARLIQLIKREYDNIKLPERSNDFCLGYDFFIPFEITTKLSGVYPIKVPTGIRIVYDLEKINSSNYSGLFLFPRSSTGIKKGINLSNCIGVIEPDYFKANNEGHIIASLSPIIDTDIARMLNNRDDDDHMNISPTVFNTSDRFIQGVFMPVCLTEEEASKLDNRDPSVNETGLREGGLGSTGN